MSRARLSTVYIKLALIHKKRPAFLIALFGVLLVRAADELTISLIGVLNARLRADALRVAAAARAQERLAGERAVERAAGRKPHENELSLSRLAVGGPVEGPRPPERRKRSLPARAEGATTDRGVEAIWTRTFSRKRSSAGAREEAKEEGVRQRRVSSFTRSLSRSLSGRRSSRASADGERRTGCF